MLLGVLVVIGLLSVYTMQWSTVGLCKYAVIESNGCLREPAKFNSGCYELISFFTYDGMDDVRTCGSLRRGDLVLDPSQTLSEFTQKWRTS